jgi:hypothetical protein
VKSSMSGVAIILDPITALYLFVRGYTLGVATARLAQHTTPQQTCKRTTYARPQVTNMTDSTVRTRFGLDGVREYRALMVKSWH